MRQCNMSRFSFITYLYGLYLSSLIIANAIYSSNGMPIQALNYLTRWWFIAIVIIIPIILGFIDKETIKERSWYFVIAAILLVVWYGVIVPFWLKRPIPTIKLLNLYVLPDIRELYGGEMYKGDAYIPP